MSKRLTASEKWEDLWFRELCPEFKLLWVYILDKCNIAGIWEVDLDLFQFQSGVKFPEYLQDNIRQITEDFFSDRMELIQDGKYLYVKKFIEFQQHCKISNLNPLNNCHKSIINYLINFNLIPNDFQFKSAPPLPLARGYGKGNSKGNSKDNKVTPEKFIEFHKAYPSGKKRKIEYEYENFIKKNKDYLEILTSGILLKSVNEQNKEWATKEKQFTPLMQTWINGKRWTLETTKQEIKNNRDLIGVEL